MNEQQRTVLAVTLCVLIFLVWQVMFPPPIDSSAVLGDSLDNSQEQLVTDKRGLVDKAGIRTGGDPTVKTVTGGMPSAASVDLAGVPAAQSPVITPESRSLNTPKFSAEINNGKGALSRFDLKKFTVAVDGEGATVPVSLLSTGTLQSADNTDAAATGVQAQMTWQLGGENAPQPMLQFSSAADRGDINSQQVQLLGSNGAGLSVTVDVTPRADSYALDYHVTVRNDGVRKVPVGLTVRLSMEEAVTSGGGMGPQMAIFEAACAHGDEFTREGRDDLLEEPFTAKEPASWVGIDRQYFVVASHSEVPGKCHMGASGGENDPHKLLYVDHIFGGDSLAQGETWEHQFTLFLGPKTDAALGKVSPALLDVVDYNIWGIPLGFIARPMVYLLELFHGWTGSWGMAIILLTLTVKLLLFRFSYDSAVSMRKMQLLKPNIEKLKERFPNDSEKQQQEQMKLFKEAGVNPLGGCLPMLLQMPVWLALYRSLWTAVDLYHQPFLWLADLTAKEPGIPTIAIALGITSYAQQLLTPATTDNQQAMVMRWVMPGMFVFFMLGMPSGLVLYIFVNSILTMLQQLVINRKVGTPLSTPSPALKKSAAST